MVNCQLIGGLGNMMFQIASMESLAKDQGFEVNYTEVVSYLRQISGMERTETYNPFEYLIAFKNFEWKSKVDCGLNYLNEIPFAYVDIQLKEGNTYKGYFQSEKYFIHNRGYVLSIFEPSISVNDKLKRYDGLLHNKKTCSIHIRRGDYLNYPTVHFLQNMDYFVNAANIIGQVDSYIVFSDDIVWCKKMFLNDSYFFNKEIVFIENEKDYVELFLMSKCNYNIVSNSSFSWWGAWLNENENKKIVAPKKWWCGYDKDVVPESWIKI